MDPSEADKKKLGIDNEGNIINYNRATRRRKLMKPRYIKHGYINVPSNSYTKLTHKIKKERLKNAPTEQQRHRAIAKARKARKADYSQIS